MIHRLVATWQRIDWPLWLMVLTAVLAVNLIVGAGVIAWAAGLATWEAAGIVAMAVVGVVVLEAVRLLVKA